MRNVEPEILRKKLCHLSNKNKRECHGIKETETN